MLSSVIGDYITNAKDAVWQLIIKHADCHMLLKYHYEDALEYVEYVYMNQLVHVDHIAVMTACWHKGILVPSLIIFNCSLSVASS
jgi:hypothetical protein